MPMEHLSLAGDRVSRSYDPDFGLEALRRELRGEIYELRAELSRHKFDETMRWLFLALFVEAIVIGTVLGLAARAG